MSKNKSLSGDKGKSLNGNAPKTATTTSTTTAAAASSTNNIDELKSIFSQKWYSVSDLKKIEEKTGKQYKKGKFTIKEKEILSSSLMEWLEDNSITMEEFLQVFFINKTSSRQSIKDSRFKDLFKFLASKMDGRPVLLTYQCIRRMYHPNNGKGRFSGEEDKQLLLLQIIHGSDWEEIGRRMDRYGMNCRDRYREIGIEKTEWTMEEKEKIASSISGSPTHRKDWSSMAYETKKSESQCKSMWMDSHLKSLNNGLRPSWTGGLEYSFLKRIKEYLSSGGEGETIDDESEINWKYFLERGFDYVCIKDHDNDKISIFHPYNLRDRFNILKKRVRGREGMGIRELIDELIIED